MTECGEVGCDNGWIHHQHPMKPSGVILNSTPCRSCNADGKRPYPSRSQVEVPFGYAVYEIGEKETLIGTDVPLRVGRGQANEPQFRSFAEPLREPPLKPKHSEYNDLVGLLRQAALLMEDAPVVKRGPATKTWKKMVEEWKKRCLKKAMTELEAHDIGG